MVLSLFYSLNINLNKNQNAHAEEIASPSISISSSTITAGGGCSLYIKANNFLDVASFEFWIYYDQTAFGVPTVYSSSFISGITSSYNSDESGVIYFNAITTKALNGSGDMWRVYFPSNKTASGKYNITVAVGDVYNSTLQTLDVVAQNGSIIVNPAQPQVQNLYVYSSLTKSTIKQGESVSMRVYASNANQLAAADFECEFDSNLLQLDEVIVSDALKNANGALYSINQEIQGYIKVSYACMDGITGYKDLITLKFTAFADTNSTTQISFSASSVYNKNLETMKANDAVQTLNLEKKTVETNNPDVSISVRNEDENIFADVIVEGVTNLAAADFEILYDKTLLECVQTTAGNGQTIVVNPNMSDGSVKFSFINENGINKDTTIITLKFSAKQCFNTTLVNVTGKSLVDSSFNNVEVDYKSANISNAHNYVSSITAPTCTEKGYTTHTCSRCQDNYVDTYVNALGHNHVAVVTQPTCTEQGYTTHTCSRCEDSYIDSYVNALGHSAGASATCTTDQICTRCSTILVNKLGHNHVAVVTQPTCTEKGYTTHTCSRCEDSYVDTYVNALGHSAGASATCTTDQTCTRCNTILVNKFGHNHVAVVTQPTCTEKGYTTHTCSRCNDSYKDNYIDALRHDLIHHEGKEPTINEVGFKPYDTCSRCDYSSYEEIPKLDYVAMFNEMMVDIEYESDLYNALYQAILTYNNMTAQEKGLVETNYQKLLGLVNSYNNSVEIIETSHEETLDMLSNSIVSLTSWTLAMFVISKMRGGCL